MMVLGCFLWIYITAVSRHQAYQIQPISSEVGTLCKTSIKTENNDLQILFKLNTTPVFSMGDRSGLQAGQSGTRTLTTKPRCWNTSRMWLGMAVISRDIPEEDVAWMAAYVAPEPVCTFQH
ncbi:hypothetical protein XENOCAPTIV_019184 [Xenoophorus captivus]|uniref:Uncharacterized protein n=1 Tax=Xenoophorus captivus TaxID=1517983 RepID=A0ABV0Q3T8_9TELE